MAISNLKSLIGKLNTACRKSLESAAGLCLSHTHYDVELEHFFIKLLDIQDTDFQKILRYFEINESHLIGDLMGVIEKFKTGNARTPALSPRIPQMIQRHGWWLRWIFKPPRSAPATFCWPFFPIPTRQEGLFQALPCLKKSPWKP